jgi:hypothetical protein
VAVGIEARPKGFAHWPYERHDAHPFAEVYEERRLEVSRIQIQKSNAIGVSQVCIQSRNKRSPRFNLNPATNSSQAITRSYLG